MFMGKRTRDGELQHDERLDNHTRYKCATREEVLSKWDDAQKGGTAFHAEIERFLLLPERPETREEQEAHFECPEKGLFLDFLEVFELKGWRIW